MSEQIINGRKIIVTAGIGMVSVQKRAGGDPLLSLGPQPEKLFNVGTDGDTIEAVTLKAIEWAKAN